MKTLVGIQNKGMKELLSVLAVCMGISVSAQVRCVQGDCYNGRGTCTFPSGARYEGQFRGGQMHGMGTVYFPNGDLYSGDWFNQAREGRGRFTFASGDEYIGEFRQNKMQGRGVMTYVSGNVYEGFFSENAPNGEGVLRLVNGNRYEGRFVNGNFHGPGTLFYADGSRYQGDWRQNKRHGQGTFFHADGQVEAGTWDNDIYLGGPSLAQEAERMGIVLEADSAYLRNCNLQYCAVGMGEFTYRNGTRYLGEFANGIPEGLGKVYYNNGDRYEGGWKRHAPHGRGIMYYQAGGALGAVWEYGQPVQELFREKIPTSTPPADMPDPAQIRIWAVIVGVAQYPHMPVLRYTDDDAYQVYAFLRSPQGGALPDEQVRLLIDEDANYSAIVNAMNTLYTQADGDDVIVFYFSGHGLPGYFLPVDFDGFNNRLTHEEVSAIVSRSKARHKLVIADACHAGTFPSLKSGLTAASTQTIIDKYYSAFAQSTGGMALLLSSKGEEYSLEDGGLRSGVFSHFLIKGLKGPGDRDGNGLITIQEIYDYVYRQVRLYTANVQTPLLLGKFDRNMPAGVIR